MAIRRPLTLILAALIACGMSAGKRYETLGALHLEPGDTVSLLVEEGSRSIWAELRGAIPSNTDCRGASSRSWSISWDEPSDGSRYVYRIGWGNTNRGWDDDERYATLTLTHDGEVVATQRFTRYMALYGVPNTLGVEWTDGHMSLWAGEKQLVAVESPRLRALPPARVDVTATAPLDLTEGRAIIETPDQLPARTQWTQGEVCRAAAMSGDPLTGVWEYLDRDFDTSLAKLGGRYRIGIVAAGDHYDVIYLGGDDCGRWREGMIKGALTPTQFVDSYRMTWRDADGRLMGDADEIWGQIDGVILTVTFGSLNSKARFAKRLTD